MSHNANISMSNITMMLMFRLASSLGDFSLIHLSFLHLFFIAFFIIASFFVENTDQPVEHDNNYDGDVQARQLTW